MLHRKILSLLLSMSAVVLITLWLNRVPFEVSTSNSVGMATASAGDKVDFRALITRTDHIEVCTRETTPLFDRTLGPGWLPEGLVQLTCECIQDGALYVMEDLYPDQHVMHNAVLQLALNMDVSPIILNEKKYPGNISAFYDYLASDGKAELGFNDTEFIAAMEVVGDAARSRTPEEVLATVQSCADAVSVGQSQFPGIDFENDPFFVERAYALRRLEFDKSIDVTGLNVSLTSSMPVDLCETLIVQGANSNAREREKADEICEKMIRNVMCCLKHLSDEDQWAAIRIGLGWLYVKTHRTTSETKDALFYVLEHYQHFGWSKEQLLRVSSTMHEKTESAYWLAFMQLLETGTIEEGLEAQF